MTAGTSAQPASAPAAHSVPKWKIVLGWLKPTRTDGLIYLGALMVLVALIEPTLDSWTSRMRGRFSLFAYVPSTFAIIAGCIAAMACAMVWKKLDWRFARHALGWCVLTLAAFAYAIFEHRYGAWGNWMQIGVGYDEEWLNGPKMGWGCALVLAGLAAVFCVFWLATWVCAYGVRKLGGRKVAKFSRVKLMIVIAIVLFVIAKIQSFFFPQGFAAGLDWNGPIGFRVLFQAIGATAGVIALYIFPSWLLTQNIRVRWKWTFCAVVLGIEFFWLLVMMAVSQNYRNDSTEQHMLNLFASQFSFLVALMLIQQRNDPNMSLAEVDSDSNNLTNQGRGQVPRCNPTFWSFAPTTLLITIVTSMWLVDTGVLLDFWDWDLARKVKRVARETDYQVQCYPAFWGGQTINVNLKKNADPDILTCIVGETIGSANLYGLTPEIDTKVFSGAGVSWLSLTNSRITPAQLEDIAATCTSMQIQNVEVVGDSGSAQLNILSQLFINSNGPGELGSLLRSIESTKSLARIYLWVQGKLNQDDLDAIVEASQTVPVEINWLGLNSFAAVNYQSKLPMRNVMVPTLNFAYSDGTIPPKMEKERALRYLLETDMAIAFDLDNEPQLFWDLVFAKGRNGLPDFEQQVIRQIHQESDFVDVAQDYHLVFGTNENGEITDLFIPQATSIFGKIPAKSAVFQSLETLSFDPMWIIQDNSIYHASAKTPRFAEQPERITGVGFEQLKNLKRLDLGGGTIVVDQSFLERIPKIEHLDIHFDQGLRPRVDFSVCKNLKTLVYFGTPPKETAKQLSGLAKLKTVTLIDEEDGTLDTEEKRANLLAAIPNAKVSIVSLENFYPTPPQKFIDHVKERGIKIRKERLGKPIGLPKMSN